jgi:flavodoxin
MGEKTKELSVMKNLIVYYSWTGNTEAVAKELQQKISGDLAAIDEVKQRMPGIGFAGAAVSALMGLKSKVKPMNFSLKGYDNIIIGGPMWASRTVPAINTFISEADLTNKNVYVFVTLGDDKAPQKAIDSLRKRIEKRGGKFVDSFFVQTQMGKVIPSETVKELLPNW